MERFRSSAGLGDFFCVELREVLRLIRFRTGKRDRRSNRECGRLESSVEAVEEELVNA